MVSLADLQEPVLCFSKFDTFLEMERRGKPRMPWARPMTFNFAPISRKVEWKWDDTEHYGQFESLSPRRK